MQNVTNTDNEPHMYSYVKGNQLQQSGVNETPWMDQEANIIGIKICISDIQSCNTFKVLIENICCVTDLSPIIITDNYHRLPKKVYYKFLFLLEEK